VEGSTGRVGVHLLADEVQVLHLNVKSRKRKLTLVAVEAAGDIQLLAADNCDLLAWSYSAKMKTCESTAEQLLCNSGSQTADQMATTINNDLLLEHHGSCV
jgi:hypothetical protein